VGGAAVLLGRKETLDQIRYWNRVALESERPPHREPSRIARALAMTHLAIYEAFRGTAPASYRSYLVDPPAPARDAGPEAAMAVAAHTVLTGLYPEQTARLDAALQWAGLDGAGITAGSAHGLAVGRAVLAAGMPPA